MKPYTQASDEFLANQRMLVLAPHADDEAFGCAGTMARIKSLGGEVYVVVVSVGDLHHYDGKDGMVLGNTRSSELANAMASLKVDDYEILYQSTELHERIDTIPRRELIEQFEKTGRLAMDTIKPTIVAIPATSAASSTPTIRNAASPDPRPARSSMRRSGLKTSASSTASTSGIRKARA